MTTGSVLLESLGNACGRQPVNGPVEFLLRLGFHSQMIDALTGVPVFK